VDYLALLNEGEIHVRIGENIFLGGNKTPSNRSFLRKDPVCFSDYLRIILNTLLKQPFFFGSFGNLDQHGSNLLNTIQFWGALR
jgi:hypothetical protein